MCLISGNFVTSGSTSEIYFALFFCRCCFYEHIRNLLFFFWLFNFRLVVHCAAHSVPLEKVGIQEIFKGMKLLSRSVLHFSSIFVHQSPSLVIAFRMLCILHLRKWGQKVGFYCFNHFYLQKYDIQFTSDTFYINRFWLLRRSSNIEWQM